MSGRLPQIQNPEEFILEGLIPSWGVVVIAADEGAGKSTFLRNLAVKVVTGNDWLGRKVKKCGVYLTAGEDYDEALPAIYKALQEEGANPKEDRIVIATDFKRGAWKEYMHDAKNKGCQLIILDPGDIAIEFDADDEYKYSATRQKMRALEEFAKELGLLVIITWHTNKGQTDKRNPFNRINAGKGLAASCRVRMLLDGSQQGTKRTLYYKGKHTKQEAIKLDFDEGYYVLSSQQSIREEVAQIPSGLEEVDIQLYEFMLEKTRQNPNADITIGYLMQYGPNCLRNCDSLKASLDRLKRPKLVKPYKPKGARTERYRPITLAEPAKLTA